MALTRRQREVVEVIRDFISRNGYSPSLEEIGKALGLSSVATVHKHVTHLVSKGYARRVWNQNRSIELTAGPDAATVGVPVAGLLAAGAPIVTVPDGGTTMVPGDFVPEGRKVVALRVSGESLLHAGMRDGDFAVVEEGSSARDGDAIVALHGGAAIVAVYRGDRERSWLDPLDGKPGERDHSPFEVHGILRGLVRRYSKP